jgi:hypothetical protein
MQTGTRKPAIVLAFANDRHERVPRRDLPR